MSYHQTIKCDECETPKGATNGWFGLVRSNFGFFIAKLHDLEERKRKAKAHYCSQQCASTAFQKFMDGKESSVD